MADTDRHVTFEDEEEEIEVKGLTKGKVFAVLLAVVSLVVFVVFDMGFGQREYKGERPAQRCAGLVLFCAILWASDAVPSYITSLAVPRDLRLLSETDNLLVPASYCNSTDPLPGHPMQPAQAAVVASGAFFNPVILMFLCGFSMSAVLTKFGLSRRLARLVLSRAGKKPTKRLGFLMVLCIAVASVLNNVPAAVLGTSLLAPSFAATIKTTWPKYSLVGVAYACNIGGMISPIASPQNVIAVIALATATKGDVTLSFASWLMVGIPFCAIATVTAFFTMQLFYGKGLPKQMPSTARMRRMSMASVISDSEHHILAGAGAHNPYENVMATPHPNKSAPPMDDDSEQELRTPTQAEAIRVRQGWDNEGYDAPSLEDQSSSPLLAPRRRGVSAGLSLNGPSTSTNSDRKLRKKNHTIRDVVIVATILVTVLLWVIFSSVEFLFGNIGLIALIPILLFGSLGYLTKQDFNSLSWDTLMLLGGGLSLGTVVDSSGLLLVVGDTMSSMLDGASVFVVLLAFSSLVAVLANFISSTVSAVLLLPVIATVGVNVGHPRMLVILCVFMTSGAMGLAVSSFPNANSASIRMNGESIAQNSDFIKTGFFMSLVVLVLVNTVGFGLCSLFGF